jgi:hypothetical protein
MPVQFVCPKCRRTLSVTRRKIGQQVSCPKCAAVMTVPADEPALSASRGGATIPPELEQLGIGGLVDFDEMPDLTAAAASIPQANRPLLIPPRQSPPIGPVPISRRAIYLQAVLLLLVASVAFGLGYWLGGVDAKPRAENTAAEQPIETP